MRFVSPFSCFLPLAFATLWLSGCENEDVEPQGNTVEVPVDSGAPAQSDTIDQTDEQLAGATPMAERVATVGLLNKRNNVSQDFELKPGETAEQGPVIIRLEACERTAPYEFPQETGAFVQVDVRERGQEDHSRIFSGWLFKQSPSLNVVEHPVYDVWVKDCAMAFPGDE